MGHGFNGVGCGPLALLCPLQRLPIDQDLFGGVCLDGAEDVGMAVHQLLRYAVYHIVHGEAALFHLYLGVEGHLHQDVSQLLAHVVGVVPVQGVQDLISLLQKVPADGRVGLLPVPGTAAWSAEEPGDFQQVLPAIAGFTLKIYHRLPAFASFFP